MIGCLYVLQHVSAFSGRVGALQERMCLWTIKMDLTRINVNRGICQFLIFLLPQLLTDVTCEAKTKVCLKLYRN